MKLFSKITTAIFFTAILVTTPAMTFAENGNDTMDKKELMEKNAKEMTDTKEMMHDEAMEMGNKEEMMNTDKMVEDMKGEAKEMAKDKMMDSVN